MNARERFGPPQQQGVAKQFKDLEQTKIQDAGSALQRNGVTHSAGQGQAMPARGPANPANDNDVRKDLGVAQGTRPALSPDDRNRQAHAQADIQQAGQALKNAGVQGGQAMSASQQFAPAHTPKSPQQGPPSRSR